MREVFPNIYLLEIPLPENPLRALNSYIIAGKDRNLVIDTGFNRLECKDALSQGLVASGIDLKKTALVITHAHTDHAGLAGDFAQQGFEVFMGEVDAQIMNASSQISYWERIENSIRSFGLEADNISFSRFPGFKFSPHAIINFSCLKEGDQISLGEYNFQVIDIPGHSPGHIGLYEKQHRLFFCGDHILDKITPNIGFWGPEHGDMLGTYLQSLRKISAIEIDYLFP
ncbi:MAG TPA: MBL fold metallo-hydrolase, partial [Bacillota bacterium]|nr:MBL fold metallo-hydrolase [Bacillota bacterium]